MSRTRPGHGCVCFGNGGFGNFARGSCMAGSAVIGLPSVGVVCARAEPLAAAAIPRPTTPTARLREISGFSGFMILTVRQCFSCPKRRVPLENVVRIRFDVGERATAVVLRVDYLRSRTPGHHAPSS